MQDKLRSEPLRPKRLNIDTRNGRLTKRTVRRITGQRQQPRAGSNIGTEEQVLLVAKAEHARVHARRGRQPGKLEFQPAKAGRRRDGAKVSDGIGRTARNSVRNVNVTAVGTRLDGARGRGASG